MQFNKATDRVTDVYYGYANVEYYSGKKFKTSTDRDKFWLYVPSVPEMNQHKETVLVRLHNIYYIKEHMEEIKVELKGTDIVQEKPKPNKVVKETEIRTFD